MTVPQRFVGPSVRAVMGEARRVLGDSAMIIDQRTVDGQVELIASAGIPESTTADAASGQRAAETPAAIQVPSSIEEPLEEIIVALPEVPTTVPMGVPTGVPVGKPMEPPPAARQPEALSTGPAAQPIESASAGSAAVGPKLQELRRLGFSAGLLQGLSAQAVTPRVAVNELLQRCRFTDWRALHGLVPVIGPAGAGVTTATLRTTALLVNLPGTAIAPMLVAAEREGIANGEKLRQAGALLGLKAAVRSPSRLRALAATLSPGQVALFDLAFGEIDRYSDALIHLLCHELITDLAIVVPAHWEPQVVTTELEALSCLEGRPVRKHLLFSGLDRCERIAPWIERALSNHWQIGLLGAGSDLGIPAEVASEAALRRLLLRQIDRLQGSTMVTSEPDSVAGADLCMQYR